MRARRLQEAFTRSIQRGRGGGPVASSRITILRFTIHKTNIYVFTILKIRSRIKVKNVTLVPFYKTDCFSTSHCSWVLMENALGWLVPSFTSLQNFTSKLSPRPRFTHSSFIPQKVVTWFLKAFKLLCELFRPILTHSFEPTNLPLVHSCSEW